MHRDSETVIEQIHTADPLSDQQAGDSVEGRGSLEETVAARVGGAFYTGPERRAQGYLIAEIIPDIPPVSGQEPEFDRPR